MELRAGYKRTEVGVIPEAWEVLPFAAVFRRANARAHQVPAAQYLDMGALPIIDQGQTFVVGYTDDERIAFRCPPGGLVVLAIIPASSSSSTSTLLWVPKVLSCCF
jgi:hypothetical protein